LTAAAREVYRAIRLRDRGVDAAVDQDGKGRRFAEGGQVQGLGARHGHDYRAELQAEVDDEPQGVLVGRRESHSQADVRVRCIHIESDVEGGAATGFTDGGVEVQPLDPICDEADHGYGGGAGPQRHTNGVIEVGDRR